MTDFLQLYKSSRYISSLSGFDGLSPNSYHARINVCECDHGHVVHKSDAAFLLF